MSLRWLLAAFLLLLTQPALAAVAVDAVGNNAAETSSPTNPYSFTITLVASGPKCVAVHVFSNSNNGVLPTIVQVDVGGDWLVPLPGTVSTNGHFQTEIWGGLTALTGSQTVSVYFTGFTGGTRIIWAVAISATGCSGFGGYTTATDSDGTPAAISVTSVSGDLTTSSVSGDNTLPSTTQTLAARSNTFYGWGADTSTSVSPTHSWSAGIMASDALSAAVFKAATASVLRVYSDWDFTDASSTTKVYNSLHTTTSGNALLFIAAWADSTKTVTVTDNCGGNTYTKIDDATQASGAYDQRAALFYVTNIVGCANYTTTATWSGATTNRVIGFIELQGASTSAPLAGHAVNGQATPGTGTDAITSTAITPSADNALVISITSGDLDGSVTINLTNRWGRSSLGLFGGTGTQEYLRGEAQLQTTAASVTGTFTSSTTSAPTITFITAFVPVASASARGLFLPAEPLTGSGGGGSFFRTRPD